MRRIVSRLLLVALALATLAVVFRGAWTGRGYDRIVAMDGLHAGELSHQAFTVAGPARFAIDAAGSFEERPDTTLAAYAWIVRRPDGAVVWRQRPGAHPARGLLSSVRDTVELPSGDYEAYFASYGDPLARAAATPAVTSETGLRARIREALSQGGLAWQGEAGRWHLTVAPATDADRHAAAPLDRDEASRQVDSSLVWATGALGSDAAPSALLRVTAPATVELDAVLEAAGGAVADSAALVRATAPFDTLWAFRAEGSAWAGGSVKNRQARTRLRLDRGLYRLSARTDGAHAAGDWTANPPWAPWAWGVRLRRAAGAAGGPPGAVAVLDAATAAAVRLPEIAGVRCVGPDRTWQEDFTLSAPTVALLAAQGEVSRDGLYDYATLSRDGAEVWRMTRAATQPAGGADRNRRAEALLALAPGTYRLTFETDGSHDCESGFDDDEPDDGSLWGAVLLAVDPAFNPATVRRLATSSQPDEAPMMADDDPAARTLVEFARVGNDARLETSFALDGPTRLRITATGELFPDEALDVGWVEDASGTRVWALTRGASVPAGGASQNRRFDGTIVLPSGRYTAHYVSNARHAYGDFGDGAPDDPAAWGLRIDQIAE